MELNIHQLGEMFGVNSNTVRVWLCNFRFNKYRVPNVRPEAYNINHIFLEDLKEYLDCRKQTEQVKQCIKNMKYVKWRLGHELSRTC